MTTKEKLHTYHAIDVETERRVEVLLTPEEAFDWDIGTERLYGGRRMRRVGVQVDPGFAVGAVARDLKVVGWSQPGGVPGATAYMDPFTGKVSSAYNPIGVPLYDSDRDLNATAKATNGAVVHRRLTGEKDDARPEPKPADSGRIGSKWTRGQRKDG